MNCARCHRRAIPALNMVKPAPDAFLRSVRIAVREDMNMPPVATQPGAAVLDSARGYDRQR